MTVIQEITADPAIWNARFSCDLAQCKGACCTMPGGCGAPLHEAEVAEIRKALPVVQKYLPAEHLRVIADRGVAEEHYGGFTTPCYNNRACVYVTYDGDIAKCAFEKAYRNGEISWVKPLSCHLFPIRVQNGGRTHLRYERISECSPGRTKGERLGIPLLEFLRDPLIRAFGKRRYRELTRASIRSNVTMASSDD